LPDVESGGRLTGKKFEPGCTSITKLSRFAPFAKLQEPEAYSMIRRWFEGTVYRVEVGTIPLAALNVNENVTGC
jgi:hypothetical protein